MEWILGAIQTALVCATVLGLAFFVLVSLPQSRLRNFLMEILGWLTAAFCAVYCVSPVDVVPEIVAGPFGLVDDLGAAVLGVMAAMNAYQAGKKRQASADAQA